MFTKQINNRFNIIKCVKFYNQYTNLSQIKLTPRQSREQKMLAEKYLEMSYQKAINFFRVNKMCGAIDNYRLEETLKSLKKIGLENEDIQKNPTILTYHSNTIEHIFSYLKEAGFNTVNATILLRFRNLIKRPISLLKAHGVISEDLNVADHLHSHLNPKPDEFPIIKTFSDEDSIINMHRTIIKNYLEWRLEATPEEVHRICSIYELYKYKSLQLVCLMINFLINELDFTREKILHQGYLLQISPTNPQHVMERFPYLAGVEIKSIFKKTPKLISTSVDNISKNLHILKDHGIPDEAIQKCFEIFTLSPETIEYRLNELKNIPEFSALLENKRILELVFCHTKAKLRLEHLQKSNLKNSSLHLLITSNNVFEKFVNDGNDKTKGTDICNIFAEKLNLDSNKIRKEMGKNPNWYHIPLTTAIDTFNFLKYEKKFTEKDMSFIPVLLVYPKNTVKEALEECYNYPGIDQKSLSPEEILNLCLYFIERKHHFSGNGIWNSNPVGKINVSNLET